MNETMNNVEVTTMPGEDEVTTNVSVEDVSSGPSKGFVTLVVGGIAALAVGAAVLINRKKNKRKAEENDEIFDEDEDDDTFDQDEAEAVDVVDVEIVDENE